MKYQEIINQLPYSHPFLFVDSLSHVSEDGATGTYTFKKSEYFYQGHFKDHPITPGVILTECMAQIGVVCLGIFLTHKEGIIDPNEVGIALSESHVEYLTSVEPGEKVKVVSEKIYYRFGKLKCKVSMYNVLEKIVCQGTISGMIYNQSQNS